MLKLTSASVARSAMELLAVPVCQDADLHKDDALQSLSAKAKAYPEFSGEKDQQILLYDLPDTKIRRAVFFGLGKLENLDRESLRALGGKAVKAAQAAKCASVAIAVPGMANKHLELPEMAKAIGEGAFLANRSFEKYKSESKYTALAKISLMVPPREAKTLRDLVAEVEIVCGGTLLAREWVNTPSNDKPPLVFAKEVAAQAKKVGLKVQIHDEARLKRDKFGALLAVAAGSSNPPCLVELVHAPRGPGGF